MCRKRGMPVKVLDVCAWNGNGSERIGLVAGKADFFVRLP